MVHIEVLIDRVIEQLDRVVQEETTLLRARAAVEFDKFNRRKSQGLYDLSLALKRLEGQSLEGSTAAKLDALRSTLKANEAALSVHLQAVREVADVISTAVRAAESDGTYEPPRPLRRSI